LLRRVRDYAEVRGDGTISHATARDGLAVFGVDGRGLDKVDRSILSALCERFGGGPVGLSTLAIAVSEPTETVEDVYEPYLIQQGLLLRTPRGRVATTAAWRHLGLVPPPSALPGADPSMFESMIEQLAPDYRLLVVAAPGPGPSELPAGPLTSAASGAAVLAILNAHGIDRAGVVGCSWGGIAGIQAAAQAPERIAAVAAFNTPFGPGADDIGTRAILWMTGWIGHTEFFGRRVAAGFFSPQTHKEKPPLVDKFVAVFPTRDQNKLQAAARAVLIERESLLPLLHKVRAPVLVVCEAGLGTLNRTALTVEAIVHKQLSCAGLVIGAWPADPGAAARYNRVALEKTAPIRAVLPAGAAALPPADFAAMSSRAFDAGWVTGLV
jgi:hypothetical protein